MSSFRKHINKLADNNKLITVTKQLSTDNEISAGIYKASIKDDGYAAFFNSVENFPGWSVLGGMYATDSLLALGLDTHKKNLLKKYLNISGNVVKPSLVDTSPVKDIIIKGQDVDLSTIPFLIYCEDDESAYHHSGIIFTKDEDNGVNKGTIKRIEVLDSNTMGIYTSQYSNFSRLIYGNELNNKPTEVAIAVGVDPEIYVTSQFPNKKGVGCVELAGGIKGKPVNTVRCETIDLEVPADSEVIIEGVITKDRVLQGKWGTERANYVLLESQYTSDNNSEAQLIGYTFKITAITRRKNPIYLAMTTAYGNAEDRTLCKYITIMAIHNMVISQLRCKDDFVAADVMHGEYAIVSIKNADVGAAKRIIHALTTIPIITKVVVVDDDIDIYNLDEVNWAIVTRSTASKDVVVYPSPLNLVTMDKWGIDATVPSRGPIKGQKEAFKKSVPRDLDKVDYI
ncbi:UbiD family decarboxylase [Francisella philomiragia]|uniref:3-octaprenyl-4-hydroxybenzoate carboxy-lyase family protein n=1 Tax=Francisella philomiragia TaxID=28110 RepID=A0AAW3DCX1_9GAMM|nr:UbiD family decarboxylase [Francisella philomiragia]KFJ43916.1 3-octaprenyl-4-hydroxybenzoate carboxy-lyase family protein [Francisella philomiragia]MBK2254418.1 UbiD family decarboxylase [Francisella philomiragia]MBK2258958.1 UbiD family decarboxylase [Francisella philomiragia]MBK2272789.1 UbiD family decarboxylase [Francisella philomiragia]MBK2276572.1 UbiD family decarboxylase [Francisella philomiragia]